MFRQEKSSKEEAKLMEGTLSTYQAILTTMLLFSSKRHSSLLDRHDLHVDRPPPLSAFSRVLAGLWDVDGEDTEVNPRQFYSIFKETVPYFSGYR